MVRSKEISFEDRVTINALRETAIPSEKLQTKLAATSKFPITFQNLSTNWHCCSSQEGMGTKNVL